MIGKKAQIGMEHVVIIGIVLVITIPVIGNALHDVGIRMGVENDVNKLTDMAQAMETVANLGPGNVYTISNNEKIIIKDGRAYAGEVSDEVVSLKVHGVSDMEIGIGSVKIVNSRSLGVVAETSPVISEIIPDSGVGGEVVRIRGEGMGDVPRITFGGNGLGMVGFEEEGIISFRVPLVPVGTYVVVVEKYVEGTDIVIGSNELRFEILE